MLTAADVRGRQLLLTFLFNCFISLEVGPKWRRVLSPRQVQKNSACRFYDDTNDQHHPGSVWLLRGLCICVSCDAIRVTVNVYDAADDLKINIFLEIPSYPHFYFGCVGNMHRRGDASVALVSVHERVEATRWRQQCM